MVVLEIKSLYDLAPTYFSKFISCCSPSCSLSSYYNRHPNVMFPPPGRSSPCLCLPQKIHLSQLSLNITSSEKLLLTLQSTLGLPCILLLHRTLHTYIYLIISNVCLPITLKILQELLNLSMVCSWGWAHSKFSINICYLTETNGFTRTEWN